jgi:hypothetical protein
VIDGVFDERWRCVIKYGDVLLKTERDYCLTQM